MNQITEAVLTEKIAQLSEAIESRDAIIRALVFMVGKGKTVSIGKGVQRQAFRTIDGVKWRTLSSGETRVTVTKPPEEGKNDD